MKNIINLSVIIIISITLIITTTSTNTSKTKKITNFELKKNDLENLKIDIKKNYKKLQKINNIDILLENIITKHIYTNIENKKLGLICTENEILFKILNIKLFKEQHKFSIENYKKYIKNKNINEFSFQKNIKNISENTITRNIQKKHNKNLILPINKKLTFTKYAYIPIWKLFKNIKINNLKYNNFELSELINTPSLYKIIYKNKDTIKTLTVSKKEININIIKNIKNTHFYTTTTNIKIRLLKKLNKYNTLNKNLYKLYLINKYKKSNFKEIATYIKNNTYKINKTSLYLNKYNYKNYMIKNKKRYKAQNSLILIKKITQKHIKMPILNKILKNTYKNTILIKKTCLKKYIKVFFNKNQTYR